MMHVVGMSGESQTQSLLVDRHGRPIARDDIVNLRCQVIGTARYKGYDGQIAKEMLTLKTVDSSVRVDTIDPALVEVVGGTGATAPNVAHVHVLQVIADLTHRASGNEGLQACPEAMQLVRDIQSELRKLV